MTTVPEPSLDEQLRMAALRACEILDTLPEAEFDDLVELAQQTCGTPAAAISFIDSNRQWLKAARGVERGVEREHAFCNHTIQGSGALVVHDAADDPRFRDNPYVAGGAGVRFYAGFPLVTSEGAHVGALCVLDGKPRALDSAQLRVLEILARQISCLLELRRQKAALQTALAERDAAVARLELVDAIRRASSSSPELDHAVRSILRVIAEPRGWAAASLWSVQTDGTALQNVGGFWLSSPARAPIEEASLQASFTRGVGLLGSAWRTGAPVWLESLLEEPGLLRVSAARAAGLSSGVAVPIVDGPRVLGLLELLSERTRLQDEDELGILTHAARELALLLARRE